MLRAMLLRLDDEEHLLLLVIHHIACDAWSLDVLLNELAMLYGQIRSGQRANLPELPVQYADYAIWQRERLWDGTVGASVEYWKKKLARPPEALDLYRDRPRPPLRTSGGAWEELRMPASLPGELHALGRRHDVTLFMTLLSAWVTLLHRRYGQDDILILTPFANRQRVEVEGLIGLFANGLILRQDLAGDPSFAELLRCVRETAVDALRAPFRGAPRRGAQQPSGRFLHASALQSEVGRAGREADRNRPRRTPSAAWTLHHQAGRRRGRAIEPRPGRARWPHCCPCAGGLHDPVGKRRGRPPPACIDAYPSIETCCRFEGASTYDQKTTGEAAGRQEPLGE